MANIKLKRGDCETKLVPQEPEGCRDDSIVIGAGYTFQCVDCFLEVTGDTGESVCYGIRGSDIGFYSDQILIARPDGNSNIVLPPGSVSKEDLRKCASDCASGSGGGVTSQPSDSGEEECIAKAVCKRLSAIRLTVDGEQIEIIASNAAGYWDTQTTAGQLEIQQALFAQLGTNLTSVLFEVYPLSQVFPVKLEIKVRNGPFTGFDIMCADVDGV